MWLELFSDTHLGGSLRPTVQLENEAGKLNKKIVLDYF